MQNYLILNFKSGKFIAVNGLEGLVKVCGQYSINIDDVQRLLIKGIYYNIEKHLTISKIEVI
jgi:hypothetical protein